MPCYPELRELSWSHSRNGEPVEEEERKEWCEKSYGVSADDFGPSALRLIEGGFVWREGSGWVPTDMEWG